MIGEIETTGSEFDNSIPIKVYPEQLELDIGNIIARCSKKMGDLYVIGDLSILTIELMDYILEKNGSKK